MDSGSGTRERLFAMQMKMVQMTIKGETVDAVYINKQVFTITGKCIKTAKLIDEWDKDVADPQLIIAGLKKVEPKVDFFTFMQRLPETEPKYDYFTEWEDISAIRLQSFDDWWGNKISSDSRNKVRKA